MSCELTLPQGSVFAITQHRAPYAALPHYKARQLDQSSGSAAVMQDLLSQASSANTASTSELLGAVRMLEAMALAVRNRSYVVMAACHSFSGAPALCIAESRESKASVKSFTAIGLSIHEIDWNGDGIDLTLSGVAK